MHNRKLLYDGGYFFRNRPASLAMGVIDRLGGAVFRNRKKQRKIPERHEIKKILLCRNDHIGDVLMLTPVIKALKERMPDVKIHLLIGRSSKALMGHIEGVDKFYCFDHFFLNRSKGSGTRKIGVMIAQIPGLSRALRNEKYDIAVDFRPYFGNVIPLLWLSGAKFIMGYPSAGFGFLLDHISTFDPGKHFTANMFDCVKYFLGEIEARQYKMNIKFNVAPREPALQLIRALSGKSIDEYIAVHPFSGNRCKMWRPEKWAVLINKLLFNADVPVVILGAASDVDDFKRMKVPPNANMIDLVGKTSFSELLAVIAQSQMLIGVDSLAAHIAGACSVRSLVLATGIQGDVIWRPWLSDCKIISKKMDCSPCYRENGCSHMKCIRDIEVADVYDGVTNYPPPL